MKQFTCVFLTIILLLTLAACQKAPEVEPVDEALDWQTQYDLGVRYLSEGNYQEAILAFEAAIEIDPKQETIYLKYAEAYTQQGDDASALRVLTRGFRETQSELLVREENKLKRKILQGNSAVAELPAAVDSTGNTNYDADTERLYRSVILENPDGTPIQFAMIADASEYWEVWLHRYTVSDDAEIQDEKLVQLFTAGGRTDFYVYYDARLDCFCAANAATYRGTPTGAWGCDVAIYMLESTVREYRSWHWNSIIDVAGTYGQDVEDMQKAGLPYFSDYYDDNYSVILNPELLGECYWLYKNDSFNVFPSDIRVQDGWMVEWTSDELARFELEMQSRAVDSGEEPETSAAQSNGEETGALLAYIDTLSTDVVSTNALKIVDAYVDALNSTDSGEGIFYPDETNTDQFWTAIYLFEVNQRKYFDENGPISWMIKDGCLIDSQQNVQDIANAMYGKTVSLPSLNNSWSIHKADGDLNYYFELSNRGAVQVALDSFEQSDDGGAALELSYSYPGSGVYLTATAQMKVNPSVNPDGEIPFYYMIESVEIRYS